MATIAIPMIALGGLYVASKTSKKEGFQNDKKSEPLIPARTSDQHYTTGKMDLGGAKNNTPLNINTEYVNPGRSNDKYYGTNNIAEIAKINDAQIVQNDERDNDFESLTGKKINVSNFRHNNMQPFFGGKVKGKQEVEGHESILDNLGGTGYLQREKDERAPLFKPTAGAKFINGAPNMNDFMQSRVNEGIYRSNDKPWEEIRVAPGLNMGDDMIGGSGGFNSGMEAREMWLPKRVDDLRVKSNPKLSFNLDGLEGPALAPVKHIGKMGKFEQHNPDSFFVNKKEMWLPGLSDVKKGTMHGKQPEKYGTRSETSVDYAGIVGNNLNNAGTYAPQTFEQAHRQQLGSEGVLGGVHLNKNAGVYEGFSSEGHEVLENNRTTVRQPDATGIVGGVIGSIVSPVLDMMRPGRKENTLRNLRECGNVNGVQRGPNLDNQRDACPATIRELNGQKMHLNVQGQNSNGYTVAGTQSIFRNNREDTHVENMGNIGGGIQGLAPASKDAYYSQRDNPYKETTTFSRMEHGAANHFNNEIHMKSNKMDGDRQNNRMFVPSTGPSMNVGVSTMSQQTKFRQMDATNTKRLQGDLLQAFKDNPYTHSLNSAP